MAQFACRANPGKPMNPWLQAYLLLHQETLLETVFDRPLDFSAFEIDPSLTFPENISRLYEFASGQFESVYDGYQFAYPAEMMFP